MHRQQRLHPLSGGSSKARRGLCLLCAAASGLAVSAHAESGADELLAQPLLADAAIEQFDLDSGFRYVIRRSTTEANQVLLRLVVRAGSLHEPGDQAGAAHVVAQTLLAGSLRRDAGRALTEIPGALADLDYRSQPAMVDFESATFTVRLPTNDSGTLSTALRYLADIAQGRSLDQQTIELVQPEIVDRERARNSVGKRLRQQLLPAVFEGTPMADHLPFCPVDEICRIGPEVIRGFHQEHFVPSEMFLVVVGDIDAATLSPLIVQEFGDLRAAPPPPPLAPIDPPEQRGGVAIVSDPELTFALVELSFIEAFEGPTRTHGDAWRRMREQLVSTAMSARLTRRIEESDASYQAAETWVGPVSGPIEIAVASVHGDPAQCEQMVAELASELASIVIHGFSPREIEEAGESILSDLEKRAERVDRDDPLFQLREITETLLSDSVLTAPSDLLPIARQLMDEVETSDLSEFVRRRFALDRASILIMLPDDAASPQPQTITELARAAFANPAPRPEEASAPPSILAERPITGQIVSLEMHPTAGLTSAWLSSGVRLHHAQLTTEPDRIAMVVSIAGGRIQEDTASRGRTVAAASIFNAPATSARRASDMRRAVVGQSITLTPDVEDDRIILRFGFGRADLETACQLVHVLLSDPVLERSTLETWRWKQSSRIKRWAVSPGARLTTILTELTLPPDDPLGPPLTLEELDRITLAEAQHWLEMLVRDSPLEIAIVGDVSRAEALELAALYFASLAPRPRVGPQAFCELRHAARIPPGRTIREQIPSPDQEATVLVAIPGVDQHERADALTLELAARLLGNRINVTATQRRRIASTVLSQHMPGVAFPGSGMLLAFGRTDPRLVDPLLKVIDASLSDLARHGPAQTEIDLVRAQVRADLARSRTEPLLWAERLASLEYRGERVEDLLRLPEILETISAEDVRSALAQLDPGPPQRLRIIVEPISDDALAREERP